MRDITQDIIVEATTVVIMGAIMEVTTEVAIMAVGTKSRVDDNRSI